MAKTQETQTERQTGLFSLGFAFNPFEHLEASNDPHISDYLVGHDMFSVAWEMAPAALFAPPGGGKTALRIYTLRACWKNEGRRRKFPISYDLPLWADLRDLTSLAAHQAALASASASDLLLVCAYQPDLYLGLSSSRRAGLLSLLQQSLPLDLAYSLGILEESGDAAELSARLDRTYRLPEPPSPERVRAFSCQAQRDLASAAVQTLPAETLFEHLLAFILEDFSFESVFLILDGVDGAGAQAGNPAGQFASIAPLLDQALRWARERLYLKAFLPLELQPLVASHDFYRGALRAVITWDVPGMAEILRRRVYVASQGRFGSLDALSSPALRDVETLIASRARPLPREAIALAGMVLTTYLEGGGEYIEPEDISTSEQQYLHRSIFPD